MKTTKLIVPTTKPRPGKTIPTVAIDLSGKYREPTAVGTGFAQSHAGVQPASSDIVTQTMAIDMALVYFDAVAADHDHANLILEGPLSYAFEGPPGSATRKNARRRRPERPQAYPALGFANGDDRPWIKNGGAAVSMMALLTLRDIVPSLPSGLTIHLFEGFYSWRKPRNHAAVALGLIADLQLAGNRIIALPQGEHDHYQTALQLLDIHCENSDQPPLIVFGSQALAGGYQGPGPHPPAH